MADTRETDVLILGAGFAGLTAARRIAASHRVLLVDRHAYQTLRPKLPEAVAGTSPCAVRLPVADALEGTPVEFLPASVLEIDPERRLVETDTGPLRYARLVVALGSQPHIPAPGSVPGAAEFALPLWDFEHACAIRRRVTLQAHSAARAASAPERRAAASVVVVGAGFAGVEVAGQLQDRLVALTEAFGLALGEAQVHVVERAPRILPTFAPALARAVAQDLVRRGVVLHLNASVRAVTGDAVILADGTTLPAGAVIWAGGVRAADAVAALGAPLAAGRIPVDSTLRSRAWPDVYAVGDAAAVTAPNGELLAQSAQIAMQAGAAVAVSVARDLAGLPPRPSHLSERGAALGLGARSAAAVVAAGNLMLTGRPARLIKDAALAHYLLALGGLRLAGAYLDPVILQPRRGRIEVGNPRMAVQHADPAPRLVTR